MNDMLTPLCVGQHLFTRDGRKIGNAIVMGFTIDDSAVGRPPKLYTFETDYGNIATLSPEEIDSMFYTFKDGEQVLSPVDRWAVESLHFKAERLLNRVRA